MNNRGFDTNLDFLILISRAGRRVSRDDRFFTGTRGTNNFKKIRTRPVIRTERPFWGTIIFSRKQTERNKLFQKLGACPVLSISLQPEEF